MAPKTNPLSGLTLFFCFLFFLRKHQQLCLVQFTVVEILVLNFKYLKTRLRNRHSNLCRRRRTFAVLACCCFQTEYLLQLAQSTQCCTQAEAGVAQYMTAE